MTPRDKSRISDGEYAELIAQAHGRRLLPWQRVVADVLGERTPTGGYAYPIAVVTVPRQCGKTTLAFDLAMGRALAHPDFRAAYTAQTGHQATERFRDRFAQIEAGKLANRVHLRRSQGTEAIRLPNGYVRAFPPKTGALRGSALDLVIVDEAQEQDDIAGRDLDADIMPTFQTRPRRQLLVIGTAGTHRSGWLRRYLELARSRTAGVALFEWGAADDADMADEATWRAVHPGIGTLTDVDTLRDALTMIGEPTFVREYLNVWTVSADVILDPLNWAACAASGPMPAGRPAFGVAVANGRRTAVIAAAVANHAEIIEILPPYEAAARLRQLREKWRPTGIVIDRVSPAGTIADELDRAGVPLTNFGMRDYANACATFAEAVETRAVRYTPHPALDEAVACADIRAVADGLWLWNRRGSKGSVAPLEAATLALWGASRRSDIKPVVMAM